VRGRDVVVDEPEYKCHIPVGTTVVIENDRRLPRPAEVCPFSGASSADGSSGECPMDGGKRRASLAELNTGQWQEYVGLGITGYANATVEGSPQRAIAFGAGPRGCAGQRLARAVFRQRLQFICKEFPIARDPALKPLPLASAAEVEDGASSKKPLASWSAFDPRVGHKFSGRTNDEQADADTDLSFMLRKIGGFFSRSLIVRLDVTGMVLKWYDKTIATRSAKNVPKYA